MRPPNPVLFAQRKGGMASVQLIGMVITAVGAETGIG